MSLTHDFRYDLHVEGANEETLSRFKEAFAATIFDDYMAQDAEDRNLFTTEAAFGHGSGDFEEEIENELHALALQFPQLELTFTAEDLDNPGYAYELTLHGDLIQRAQTRVSWDEPTPVVPFAQLLETRVTEDSRRNEVEQLATQLLKNTDYDLLYAQKLTLLEHVATGKPIPKPALEGLINLLDTMGDLGETMGRFQYDGIEPPFPMQPDYQKKICVFEPEPQPELHVLCEEMEGGDGIREFRILALSHDEDELRALMQAKIKEDEYGLIAKNGVDEDLRDNHFMTNFENGFVEYYIVAQDVLNKEQIQSMIRACEPAPAAPSERAPTLDSLISDASARAGQPSQKTGPKKDALEK